MDKQRKHFEYFHISASEPAETRVKHFPKFDEVNGRVLAGYDTLPISENSPQNFGWVTDSDGKNMHQEVVADKIKEYEAWLRRFDDKENPPKFIEIPKWIAFITLKIVNSQDVVDVKRLRKACEQEFKIVMDTPFKEGLAIAKGYVSDGHEGVSKYDPHSHLRESA